MSPLSKAVEAAGIRGVQDKCRPYRIQPEDFFDPSDAVRQQFASLIHAGDHQQIAILPSASYGLATVAQNVTVSAGQNLVVLHEQFPSNVYSWMRLAEASRANLRVVNAPDTRHDRGAAWNEAVLSAIDRQTVLVTVPHVHWADGTRFDLEAIGKKARSVGAWFVVDGTQSVGALPFDVQTLKPDALICAGYKWLMGPYSIGVAYYGSRMMEGQPLEENWITRKGSENFGGLVAYQKAYQPGAIRYDVGERSNFILIPMLKAGLDHVLSWGPTNIQMYCRSLMADVLTELREMGFWIEDEAHRGAHLFGIRLPDGMEVKAVKAALADQHVYVSTRGHALRVSPHVYNTPEDALALKGALEGCLMQRAQTK